MTTPWPDIKGARVGVVAYGGRTYPGTIIKVGRVRVTVVFKPPTGRRHEITVDPEDGDIVATVDLRRALTRALTAFDTFEELVDARGGYRPTIYRDTAAKRLLRAAYDRWQRMRNDDRRAHPARPATRYRVGGAK
jgi:hypothetical protein